jgi:pimeloyl-ACP methyl ester carboxylesterase
MIADGYAPVFLIWNSDFTTAYQDRLCCVLEGEENSQYWPYFYPVRLVGDIAAGVARAMENFGQQVIRFKQSVIATKGTEYFLQQKDIPSICATLPDSQCPRIVYPTFQGLSFTDTDAFEHLNGEDQRTVEKTAGYAVTAPLRVVSTTFFPGAGAKAWDDMVRRTRLALQEPILDLSAEHARLMAASCAEATAAHTSSSEATAAPDAKRFHPNGQGAFVIFFDRLACEIKQGSFVTPDHRKVKVELNFFGHSMGALVGNELLARYSKLPWHRIVYMAAATPVRDFKFMVAPMLDCAPDNTSPLCGHQPQDPLYRDVQFYNLMLHPLAESHDLEEYGAVPEGSLLEWIDEMFGGPKSVDDRMFGKWTNAEKTMAWFSPYMRERMHFRVFPAQARMSDGDPSEQRAFAAECIKGPDGPTKQAELPPRCHPIMHGQFADYSFWRDDFVCGPGENACLDSK